MKRRNKIWKILRAAFGLYLAFTSTFFVYLAFKSGPLLGMLQTDRLIISGPIKRYLNPVGSDEQMLIRFQRDRSIFEKLVQIHKEKCFINPQTHAEYPEVTELKKELGLWGLQNGTGAFWLPNPYSESAAEQMRTIARENEEKNVPLYEIEKQHCFYGAPKFELERFPTDRLVKGLIYFPIEPKVIGGVLYRPSGLGANDPYRYEKVLESLNDLPIGFWRIQKSCAFRKIEPQWFLFVCPE